MAGLDQLNQNVTYTGQVDSSGNLTLTISSRNSIVNWVVSQVSVEMSTAPVGAVCTLRKGGYFVTFLIPTGDAAGGDPPIYLRPGESMTVEWTGCTSGDTGAAFVVYDQIGFGG